MTTPTLPADTTQVSSLTMSSMTVSSSKLKKKTPFQYEIAFKSAEGKRLLLVFALTVTFSFWLGYFHHAIVTSTMLFYDTVFFTSTAPQSTKEHSWNDSMANDSSHELPATMRLSTIWSEDQQHHRHETTSTRTSSYGKFSREYYESLVHPAMFTHEHPERIAIILGAGAAASAAQASSCSATLREVLKHNTVEEVVLLGIDPNTAVALRNGWNQWNEDPRVIIIDEDAEEWLTRSHLLIGDEDQTDVFDVVIVDVPVTQHSDTQISDQLLQAISNSLDDYGIFVTQFGVSPSLSDSDETYSSNKSRAHFVIGLEGAGFESILSYEEARHGLINRNPLMFFVAFKAFESKSEWFASEAWFNLDLQKRTVSTSNHGEPTFLYFDSATMMRYQYPSKASEAVFWRRQPTPTGCEGGRGFDLTKENFPLSSFEVKKSTLGENAGRGVFAVVDIPSGSYLGLESGVHNVRVEPYSHALVVWNHYEGNALFSGSSYAVLVALFYGYGFQGSPLGKTETNVDANLFLFVNHGCNGTSNIDFVNSDITEQTADFDDIPAAFLNRETLWKDTKYNPAIDFHTTKIPVSHRSIHVGGEVFGNYLTYFDPIDWNEGVHSLRSECSGLLGIVERYQNEAERKSRPTTTEGSDEL